MIQHNQTSNSKFNGILLGYQTKGPISCTNYKRHIFKNQPSWETQRNKPINFTTNFVDIIWIINWKFNYLLRHVHHRFLNIIKINEKDNI